jgi:hypothetical protein
MGDFCFMARKLILAGLVLGAAALGGCAQHNASAEMVDARAVLPGKGLKKNEFVRHYMLVSVKSLDRDLPFTFLSATGELPASRTVWVGVFARTPSVWTNAPAGAHVVQERSQFPEYVHGGCLAINLVADTRTGETLSSWCNPDDSQDGPVPIPSYSAKGSPFF